MNEKKLEKLIINGFKAQDQNLEAFKKSIEIEMMTQDDLDRRLEDHSATLLSEIRELQNTDERILSILTRIDERTNEETADLYRRVDILEHRLELLTAGK